MKRRKKAKNKTKKILLVVAAVVYTSVVFYKYVQMMLNITSYIHIQPLTITIQGYICNHTVSNRETVKERKRKQRERERSQIYTR